MPTYKSLSPSPPPSAPIASAPGIRATQLQKVFSLALTTTLKSNSYANFSACFPTPAAHCAPALEGVWKQLNSKLEDGCLREYEEIVKERGVVEGLNAWDGRIEDARRRMKRSVEGNGPEQKAMHTISAEDLWRAHLGMGLEGATGVLEKSLRNSQEENEVMMQEIVRQREEIERLVAGLEGTVKDVEGAVESFKGGDSEGLRKDTWDMEMEVQATR